MGVCEMETYRVVNFVLQLVYLAAHLLFTVILFRKSPPSPIWRWFLAFTVCLWLWVSGRFAETLVYIFMPDNNSAYVFAADYQYIGITTAASSYLVWNLYLAGYGKLASDKKIRFAIFACPVVVNLTVFTNSYHRLFYTKLLMGQQVEHGPLFLPFCLWGYLLMLAGYGISVSDIVRKRKDVVKKLFLFSAFPILPAIAIVVRTVSGIDMLDYTPIVMAISFASIYLVIFKYNYVNIISASIETVMAQTAPPIVIYDLRTKSFIYRNRIAEMEYAEAEMDIIPALKKGEACFEGAFAGKSLKVDVVKLPVRDSLLITAIDIEEINEQLRRLNERIGSLKLLSDELDEENRNIDAYLDAVSDAEGIEVKQELIAQIYDLIYVTFDRIRENMITAREKPGESVMALNDNLQLAELCMKEIRIAVSRLQGV